MRRKITLQGKLKELYGGEIHFHVNSVAEAVRALCYQIKGFKGELEEGHYHVYIGEPKPENLIDMSILTFNLGDTREICIQPVLEGSKGRGGKLIAGLAMVALSFAVPGVVGVMGPQLGGVFGSGIITSSVVLKMGVGLALGGISQLLTPQIDPPKASSYESPDQRPSFLFNGAVNTTEQGGPVPLVYGRIRTGSTVVSSGLSSEKI